PDSVPGPNRASSSRRESSVTRRSPMSRTRAVSSAVVSSTEKSMSALLPGGAGGRRGGDTWRRGQPQSGGGDDVALHLVGAAPEGEDERRSVEALDAPVQGGGRGVGALVAARSEDLHEQPVGLARRLGPVHLGRRRGDAG